MTDDITTLLRDAAADPKHTPDFDELASRGRRQHVAARAGTALAVALALVGGSIVVWPGLLPSRMPVIGEGPTTPTGVEEVELPDGWQRVEIGRAVFGVPGDWTVETFTEPAHVCQNYAERATVFVLHAGPPGGDNICTLIGMRATTLTVMPLSMIPATLLPDPGPQWSDITTPAGVAGQRASLRESKAFYRFPTLDLWLQFDSPGPLGSLPDDILATLAAPNTTAVGSETSDMPSPTGSLSLPRPVADDPDAFVRAGAAGRMVDCDGPVHLGGWTLDFGGPTVGAADPHAALETFLDTGLFGLPRDGYQIAATESGRALFTYEVGRSRKVAVIVADGTTVKEQVGAPDGWAVEVFATCDPAEYHPSADDSLGQTVWTDRDGNRVPISTITSSPGHSHCDTETVTFLQLNDSVYLRDPEHRLAEAAVQPYDADARLPADATDTGYRRGADQLWLSADRTIAYLVTDDRVEAWPSTRYPVGCA